MYNAPRGVQLLEHDQEFRLRFGILPRIQLAYETWGELNQDRSNAILLHTGLSASSHAKSHDRDAAPGWWEKFIGPGLALDTSKFFVVCVNSLGGCFGSTGPSSTDPLSGNRYGPNFPMVTVEDIVRSQFLVLDALGIEKIHASVGSSMGGMMSCVAAALFPERVDRCVSISACGRSYPFSIAIRYTQRQVLMADPGWMGGFYYDRTFPYFGMRRAREIGTISYRSGPEWELRFGRKRIDSVAAPSLGPDFLIESYLDHQGESFSKKFDPNSMLYLSKAMDMHDLGEGCKSYEEGVARIKCPTLVMGVQSDVLFPSWQQREIARILRDHGTTCTYYEVDALYGHDTFLIDVPTIGSAVKGHLETVTV
jgi:homoserine O-acetyltransferase